MERAWKTRGTRRETMIKEWRDDLLRMGLLGFLNKYGSENLLPALGVWIILKMTRSKAGCGCLTVIVLGIAGFFALGSCAEKQNAKRAEERMVTPRVQAERAEVPAAIVSYNAKVRGGGGLEAGSTKTITLPGGAKMEMVWCPPGAFMMGSPEGEKGRYEDEKRHPVVLKKGFWLAKTEVTQEQWGSVMGSNPAGHRGGNLPVENVNWEEAQEFCRKTGLRLPTEAEWEYACRADSTGPYGGSGRLEEMGWYGGNGGDDTHPVGQKRGNAWGLQDMHGNVWEWCADWFQEDLGSETATDPKGTATGTKRVIRGGAMTSEARGCGSAMRIAATPDSRGNLLGFRPALTGEERTETGRGAAGAQGSRTADGKKTRSGDARKAGDKRMFSLPGGVKMAVRWCPAGRFVMGSPAGEAGRWDDEVQHEVTLTRGFWLVETEVTQGQWKALMNGETVADLARKGLRDDTEFDLRGEKQTLRAFWGLDRDADPMNRCGDLDDAVPVYNVSWGEAKAFCRRLTEKGRSEGWLPAGYSFRLPTEAEWEYACRAGTKRALPNGKDIRILGECNAPALDDIAWYGGNSSVGFEGKRAVDTSTWPDKQYPGGRAFARKVGLKAANDWGLRDMIGNVSEWCEDEFAEYPSGPVTDYCKSNSSTTLGVPRVLRGGSWSNGARCCRSASRSWAPAGYRDNNVGFRPVCSAGSVQ